MFILRPVFFFCIFLDFILSSLLIINIIVVIEEMGVITGFNINFGLSEMF